MVWDSRLNYLHFADNGARLRGNSANMQIKTEKRISSFARKDWVVNQLWLNKSHEKSQQLLTQDCFRGKTTHKISQFTHQHHARFYRKQLAVKLETAFTSLNVFRQWTAFSRLCHKTPTWMVDISTWLCSAVELGLGQGFYLPCGLLDFTWYLLATGNCETWDIWLQTWVMDESILYVLPWSCHCPDFKAGLLPSPCSRSSPGSISLLQSFFSHLAELWTTTLTVILNEAIGKPLLGFLFLYANSNQIHPIHY